MEPSKQENENGPDLTTVCLFLLALACFGLGAYQDFNNVQITNSNYQEELFLDILKSVVQPKEMGNYTEWFNAFRGISVAEKVIRDIQANEYWD